MERGRSSERAPAAYYLFRRGKKIVAAALVYYDNFFVVADCKATRDCIVARLRKNAAALGAVFKNQRTAAGEVEIALSERWVEVLGLRIEISNETIKWRHGEKTMTKWAQKLELPRKDLCPADVAGVVGRLVWDACARCITFAHCVRAINLMAKIAEECREPKDWSVGRIQLVEEDREEFVTLARRTLENRWECRSRLEPARERILVATDASDVGRGGMLLQPRVPELDVAQAWKGAEAQLSINIRELLACMRMSEQVAIGRRATEVWVAVDNMTALAWVQGGWCRHEATCVMLGSWLAGFEGRGILIRPFYVPSGVMPADGLSRLQQDPMLEEKIAKCGAIWEEKLALTGGFGLAKRQRE